MFNSHAFVLLDPLLGTKGISGSEYRRLKLAFFSRKLIGPVNLLSSSAKKPAEIEYQRKLTYFCRSFFFQF